jgi:RHH-type rel operon transcriptional repressor/antitoxin RelB
MPSPTANFSIRLPIETREKLDALAKAVNRPRNYLIVEAIERYVEVEAWQVAQILAGLAELDAGEGIPHEQVMREMEEVIRQAVDRRES